VRDLVEQFLSLSFEQSPQACIIARHLCLQPIRRSGFCGGNECQILHASPNDVKVGVGSGSISSLGKAALRQAQGEQTSFPVRREP
jgi:hypothetical protein